MTKLGHVWEAIQWTDNSTTWECLNCGSIHLGPRPPFEDQLICINNFNYTCEEVICRKVLKE